MGRVAFVFPGQGSQSKGMLQDVSEAASLVADTFAEASAVLGYDLWQLVQEDPMQTLDETEYSQPALVAASIALWRLAMDRGVAKPDIVAGHSLGEYSALVAAEVLTFTDAVKLVQKRGQLMQSALPIGQGGMAAVLGLDDDRVIEICHQVSSDHAVVQAVNFNTPGQVVISGDNDALERACSALKSAGALRTMPLTVSAPFHSIRMEPAARKLSEALKAVTFSKPQIQIIQNVHAGFESDPEVIRANLVTQVYHAVLWRKSIERLASSGIATVVECGPGKVLSGMNRRINKSLRSLSINSVDSLATTVQLLAA